MKTNESMEALFKIISKILGPIEAKKSVVNAVYCVISDLQDEGLPVTAEAIETRLAAYVDDYVQVARKNEDAA
jgi:uncharacterized protein YqgV (UPF0045/DUF77 family)